jgi:hypothetical protein
VNWFNSLREGSDSTLLLNWYLTFGFCKSKDFLTSWVIFTCLTRPLCRGCNWFQKKLFGISVLVWPCLSICRSYLSLRSALTRHRHSFWRYLRYYLRIQEDLLAVMISSAADFRELVSLFLEYNSVVTNSWTITINNSWLHFITHALTRFDPFVCHCVWWILINSRLVMMKLHDR